MGYEEYYNELLKEFNELHEKYERLLKDFLQLVEDSLNKSIKKEKKISKLKEVIKNYERIL